MREPSWPKPLTGPRAQPTPLPFFINIRGVSPAAVARALPAAPKGVGWGVSKGAHDLNPPRPSTLSWSSPAFHSDPLFSGSHTSLECCLTRSLSCYVHGAKTRRQFRCGIKVISVPRQEPPTLSRQEESKASRKEQRSQAQHQEGVDV